ncbi:MAG: DUF2007 domain-containing protein [Chloroflexi bacterium]|nr:DUF2007 domain-containing protein [Chloroflexota bacterium]
MNWVLVDTAPDQLTAEMWIGLLVDNGIPARLRPGDTSSFLGVFLGPCGIQVQESMLEDARKVLLGEEVC